MNQTTRIIALAVLALGLAACKKDPPPAPAPAPAPTPAPAPAPAPAAVTVSGATLGSAIGADKRVTTATEAFARTDTIHVSIETSGSGPAELLARWTYTSDGKTVPVREDSQTLQASGPAVTEFHISKPDGWPAGDYQVEILLNGQVAQTKRFTVK
jgi:hypothetical protein